jgi:hypothetical protein
MPFGKQRVVEVRGRIVRHADPFHDAPRSNVRRHGVRNDFLQPDLVETKLDRGPRG